MINYKDILSHIGIFDKWTMSYNVHYKETFRNYILNECSKHPFFDDLVNYVRTHKKYLGNSKQFHSVFWEATVDGANRPKLDEHLIMLQLIAYYNYRHKK